MRELLSAPLSRGIAAILAVKLLALCAIWAAFFSNPPPHGARDVARALLSHPGAPAAQESER
jgi:hypothetical protein